MTVKGDDKIAVQRTENEEEVPSYQEAVAGGSSTSTTAPAAPPQNAGGVGGAKGSGPASAAVPPTQQNSLYPFPVQTGYGQTPYNPDSTTRILIVPGDGNLLPLHATTGSRRPGAGKRFLIALFWAVIVYMILGAIGGMIAESIEESNQPKTPPGWKHHHGHGKDTVKWMPTFKTGKQLQGMRADICTATD
jgi:hypothetical protein